MTKPKIWMYAAVFYPSEDEEKEGKKAKIVVKPNIVLAKSENEALIHAARAIPDEWTDKLSQVEVFVRPF